MVMKDEKGKPVLSGVKELTQILFSFSEHLLGKQSTIM